MLSDFLFNYRNGIFPHVKLICPILIVMSHLRLNLYILSLVEFNISNKS